MAFVPVPKDLNRVKTKVMFNLTKRQLICFSIAAAVGVPIFFLAKAHAPAQPPLHLSRTRMRKPMLPPLNPKRNPTLA